MAIKGKKALMLSLSIGGSIERGNNSGYFIRYCDGSRKRINSKLMRHLLDQELIVLVPGSTSKIGETWVSPSWLEYWTIPTTVASK